MITEHILVVDDQEAIREVAARALRLAGYKVTIASNGCEALNQILAVLYTLDQIDLVLTDLNMPQMAGLEMMEQMEQMELTTPVIVMSGSGKGHDFRAVECNGCAGLLEKPFGLSELTDLVAQVLHGHERSLQVTACAWTAQGTGPHRRKTTGPRQGLSVT